jgi:phage repressor protein C with HTH and peptisase S24 domain
LLPALVILADKDRIPRKDSNMLRHSEIWRALDRLAAKHGLSASGLARRAGLDPTAFNKSKRRSPTGKPRWPSTESVSKVLTATGESLGGFLALIGERAAVGAGRKIPLLGYARAGAAGYFDDSGYPSGSGWDEVEYPGPADPHAYALKITGDSMEPVYRSGDIVIVSPDADVKRGDRVIVKTKSGEVMAKEVARMSASKVELHSLNTAHPDRSFPRSDIQWIARILWVRQ